MGAHSDKPGTRMCTLPFELEKVGALKRLAEQHSRRGVRRTYGDLVRFAVDRYLESVLDEPAEDVPQRSLRMFVAPPIGARTGATAEQDAALVGLLEREGGPLSRLLQGIDDERTYGDAAHVLRWSIARLLEHIARQNIHPRDAAADLYAGESEAIEALANAMRVPQRVDATSRDERGRCLTCGRLRHAEGMRCPHIVEGGAR